jgi:NitT/TauT family transport system ATP-binding protein
MKRDARLNVPRDSTARAAGTVDLATTDAFVELRNVSLSYDEDAETFALYGVDMQVAKGEFAAVVGPSGCGKSSLLKLVAGLLPATSGTVAVNGELVTRPLKGVGMAFQNSTLMPWRTTLKNVMLPLEIVQPFKGERRSRRNEHVARAERLLATVGLDAFGAKFPWQLSGGMQQRASLCRALVHEPELLMLDEPFGALDAFTREELWIVMQSLWMRQRFTAMLVTHDLREAVFLADTIWVMGKGPGWIVCERRLDLPRPRTIESSFEPAFVDIVHELRNLVFEARA